MRERPNILWLTYEDTSPQFVSCYGLTPVPTTPTIDRLASEGVRFNNAFASAPVCSASRSAMITGCCNEATGLGHHRSKCPIPRDEIPGFPAYIRQAGYYATNNVKTDYNIEDEQSFIDATWDESSSEAHWRNRPEGKPFFSVFNFMDSHQSRTMTNPWRWYEETVLNHLPVEEQITPDDVAMPPFYRDTPDMRRHLSRVYNSLRLCDRRMGERLIELEADGLADDTLVFCFADHGEGVPRGKCNGIGFGYRASFVVWFPEKYAHLSPWGTQVVTDELISFEDLAPTLLSLADVAVPGHMTGRAFMGEQRQPQPAFIFAGRNRLDDTPDLCRSAMDGRFVYTRNFFPHLPVVKYQKYGDVGEIQQAIRRDYAAGELNEVQAELVQPTRPSEYLYDLAADPWEVTNLADDPAYKADLVRMRNATFEHAHEMCDVMFLPECMMVERAGASTPYQRRADTVYNPLCAMLAAADLVGGGAAAVPQQVEFLRHADAAVRYWAAVGLYAARADLGEHADTVRKRLEDSAECVRTELAAAVYAVTQDAKAKRILEDAIRSADVLIAHQAIEKVLYMPKVARDFHDAVVEARAKLDACVSIGGKVFPVEQGIEMYMYLYQGQPLYYEGNVRYLDTLPVCEWAPR